MDPSPLFGICKKSNGSKLQTSAAEAQIWVCNSLLPGNFSTKKKWRTAQVGSFPNGGSFRMQQRGCFGSWESKRKKTPVLQRVGDFSGDSRKSITFQRIHTITKIRLKSITILNPPAFLFLCFPFILRQPGITPLTVLIVWEHDLLTSSI